MVYRKRHKHGYLIGILVSFLALLFLILPSSQRHIQNGPMLPGHENLKCYSCHKDEQGSFRQQLQANVQYLLGNRDDTVSVGLRPVENNECLKCHVRPNERHPVYRFREPKYRDIRKKVKADSCVACHLEHNSKRISVKLNFCMHCHEKIKLKNDPLEVSHELLAKQKKWESCLTCHDFHGNHEIKTETKADKSIELDKLKKYFDRGENPYDGEIIHKAITDDQE